MLDIAAVCVYVRISCVVLKQLLLCGNIVD